MRNILHLLSALFALMILSALSAQAQHAPLPLGTINKNAIVQLRACPFGYYAGMTCFKGTVEACPGAVSLGFSYGVINPAHAATGTIVFLEGAGGKSPFSYPQYAQKYLQQGYQIVYLAWDSDWEYTNVNSGKSIKTAACRPATFLQYVYQNIYTKGGMCAQGASAGAGALGYALAWYGSSGFLDNVELLSGPVFGDIEEGCEVPNVPPINVCPTGQLGCDGAPWSDSPAYVDGDQDQVASWSGRKSCNARRSSSSKFAKSAWKAMSIVDGTNDPSFDYPYTAMAGWLCSNLNSVQNNSAAQGEFFFEQFTRADQTAGLSVTRINHCLGDEGVTQGFTPSGEPGYDAISDHMMAACTKRH